MRRAHALAQRAAGLLWLALLLLPNLTLAARANGWDAPRWQVLLAGLWMTACAWLLPPRRWMLVLTFPLVLAGLAVVTADQLRSVDALELVSVAYTFGRAEFVHALSPYGAAAALAALIALGMGLLLWPRTGGSPPWRAQARLAVALAGIALAVALPADSWRAAWPAALAGALVDATTGDTGLGVAPTEDMRASPRDRFASWRASREAAPDARETYVLVIGESVRSDRIPGCGGRPQVTPAPPGALLFCDVLAGASSTHSSVPLLVSRELPGLARRVPRDATLLRAFESVGFETFWLSVQERSIAWPDAANQAFEPSFPRDRGVLLPLLDRALARPERRKLIVLHAYNAHAPYGERYDAARAPFAVDGEALRRNASDRAMRDALWNDYDGAIDETMRLLRDIVVRLQAQGGEAFLVFTPDHAENMLDDGRKLTLHALKMPTYWDTAVPAIVWASGAWQRRQPVRWSMLQQNRGAALMHMDIGPTLLGAAGIHYADSRKEPVDLGAVPVPPRQRYTHLRAGQVVSVEALRREAGLQ